MKILYIIHSTKRDGSTLSFLRMIEGQCAIGNRCIVAGPTCTPFLAIALLQLGVPFYPVNVVDSIYPEMIISFKGIILYFLKLLNLFKRKRRFVKQLDKLITTERPDIIHTNVGVIHEGLKVANSFGKPHVWHIREYQDKDFNWKFFPSKKSFISQLHRSNVVTISRDLHKYFSLEDIGSKARTIYNGIFHEQQVTLQWPKEKYFLMSSRISPEKGHEDVIRAFAVVQQRINDISLVILGDGDSSYVAKLKDLAVDFGCDSAIKWMGYQQDVMSYMSKARALIVGSFFEGFGRMTAEACFSGCLVIGRNTGGTAEILGDTGGYLYEDHKGLVDSMIEVASLSQSDYMQLANKAQSVAKELYSIESNTRKINEFYLDILKQ